MYNILNNSSEKFSMACRTIAYDGEVISEVQLLFLLLNCDYNVRIMYNSSVKDKAKYIVCQNGRSKSILICQLGLS